MLFRYLIIVSLIVSCLVAALAWITWLVHKHRQKKINDVINLYRYGKEEKTKEAKASKTGKW